MAVSFPLITCYRGVEQSSEVCFVLPVDRTTGLVLALLGGSMLLIGVYLMYCGIGTIPASMSGFALALFGVVTHFTGLVLTAKSL